MSQQFSLFGQAPRVQHHDLPDATVWLIEDFLDPDAARRWMTRLCTAIPWRQEHITLFGSTHPLPRLTCWIGDPGCTYTYSGLTQHPQPWGILAPLRQQISARVGTHFTAALANRYRSGSDTVSWHADDEPELGVNPTIASLSLGATRRFVLKHRTREARLALELPPGSLLVMSGTTQQHWLHSLPRTRKPVGERINLTFRRL